MQDNTPILYNTVETTNNSLSDIKNINSSLSFKERLSFNGFVNTPILNHFSDTRSALNFSDIVYRLPESLVNKSLNDIISGMTEKQRKDKTLQDISILNTRAENLERQLLACKDGNQEVRLRSEIDKLQLEISKFNFTADLQQLKQLNYSFEELNHLSLIKAYIANKILILRQQEVIIDPDKDQSKLDMLEDLFEKFVVSSNIDTSFLSLKRVKA